MSDTSDIPEAPRGKHPLTGGLSGIFQSVAEREGTGFDINASIKKFAADHAIDEGVARFLLCRMSGQPAHEAERQSGISLIEFASAVANHPEIREMAAVAMHQMGVDALYMAHSLNDELVGEPNPPKGTALAIKNYIAIARVAAPGYFAGKTMTKGKRQLEAANRTANQKQTARQTHQENTSLLERYRKDPTDDPPSQS